MATRAEKRAQRFAGRYLVQYREWGGDAIITKRAYGTFAEADGDYDLFCGEPGAWQIFDTIAGKVVGDFKIEAA